MSQRYSSFDEYGLRHVPIHLARNNRTEKLRELLLDFDWMQSKLQITTTQQLIDDYNLLPRSVKDGLCSIQDTLKLSASILDQHKDQLPSQIIGRLLRSEEDNSQGLLHQIYSEVKRPWLRPINACLNEPGSGLVRTLKGHKFDVLTVAITPNGKHIISGSSDRTIKIWDFETGDLLKSLEGHTKEIESVSVTPDGLRLISGSRDGSIKIWELSTGLCLQTLECQSHSTGTETSWVRTVAVTPDGKYIISGSEDGLINIYDLNTGAIAKSIKWSERLNTVAVTPDGSTLISISRFKIGIWDLKSREIIRETGIMNDLYLSGGNVTLDGEILSSGREYGHSSLTIWDMETGKGRTPNWDTDKIDDLYDFCATVTVVPGGNRAIVGGKRAITVWDIKTGKCLRIFKGHSDWIRSIAVTPDGGYAVSASVDQTLKIWNLNDDLRNAPTLEKHRKNVTDISITPNGQQAVSGDIENILKLWDVESGKLLSTFLDKQDAVRIISGADEDKYPPLSVKITLDGKRIIAGGGKKIKLWDLERGEIIQTIDVDIEFSIRKLDIVPNEKFVIAGSYRGSVVVWELANGKRLHTIGKETPNINALSVSPDGNQVIVVSLAHLRVLNLNTGKFWEKEDNYIEHTMSATMTPDNLYVVTGSNIGYLRSWEMETGIIHNDRIQIKQGERISFLKISPDGRYAIFVFNGDTIGICDLDSGLQLASFSANARITCLAVSLDGQKILVGDAKGQIYFLNLENFCLGALIVTAWTTSDSFLHFLKRNHLPLVVHTVTLGPKFPKIVLEMKSPAQSVANL